MFRRCIANHERIDANADLVDDATRTVIKSHQIAGWDNSTGPGSPNGMAFINGLASP